LKNRKKKERTEKDSQDDLVDFYFNH